MDSGGLVAVTGADDVGLLELELWVMVGAIKTEAYGLVQWK